MKKFYNNSIYWTISIVILILILPLKLMLLGLKLVSQLILVLKITIDLLRTFLFELKNKLIEVLSIKD